MKRLSGLKLLEEREGEGRQAGKGDRKVCINPHLAYRDKGIPDLIPVDAVLTCEIWLRAIAQEGIVRPQ